LERLPSWEGIAPPKLAEERLRCLKLLREPTKAGMVVPLKLFQLRSRYRRCCRIAKEGLISPADKLNELLSTPVS
jgi:hypothetical protein